MNVRGAAYRTAPLTACEPYDGYSVSIGSDQFAEAFPSLLRNVGRREQESLRKIAEAFGRSVNARLDWRT